MSELFFAYLATRPEYVRAKRCRRTLVGPMRQYLVRHGSALKGAMAGAPPAVLEKALALIAARGDAEILLADFCARCRRCEWGEVKPVMAPPSPPDTDPGAGHDG